ncbi:peptidylprolyl isomerase [Roseibacillus ishigakijimensis]|uniref:peptidylprolyl isomerase n=1 Tax=Roseibacillus ishigakijimensis TaxID=454146 RepID=A0A934VND5_9BACT|nr:peptidylprolyl isomerase [Roseibacillus ishigakijimensis]MBK1834920.1 peptidylprolyl isomerase [Roseibacillus ishigakijimensis]
MKLIIPFFSLFLAVSCIKADEKQESKESTPATAETPVLAEGEPHPALKDPSLAKEKAPETFEVVFETTKGEFEVKVNREWSPLGADRFYNLVKIGYFEDIAFFRVIEGFMAQFGIHGDPAVNKVWRDANINDDGKAVVSNTPGRITFAKTGAPNSRSVQFFINYGNNGNLDGMGFTPFGEVTKGMDVVKSIYSGYGEGAPRGRGPDQGMFQAQGNALLKKSFPEMDYIKSAKLK